MFNNMDMSTAKGKFIVLMNNRKSNRATKKFIKEKFTVFLIVQGMEIKDIKNFLKGCK